MKTPPNGGWTKAGQAKPASAYEIQYGHGLLRAKSAGWPRYVAVSSPSAYRAALPELMRQPEGVVYADSLDFEYLNELADGLPDGAEMVAGIGGGLALDASKHIALRKGLPLIIAPTAVSTGSVVHGFMARWEGRNIMGGMDDFPWIDFEEVLVDYTVVLKAPPHLNTAGLGDVLCSYAGICEWRYQAKRGNGAPFDEKLAAGSLRHHQEVVGSFSKSLGPRGELTPASVKLIMTAVQERDVKVLRHPSAPASDHAFIVAVELANQRSWLHGELAALGAVIVAWHCDEKPEALVSRLRTCQVRWKPMAMGMSHEELGKGLEYTPTYMGDKARGRDMNSILRQEPIAGKRFEELWRFLQQV